MEVFCPWTLHYFEIFFFFHSALHHDALRCSIDVVAKNKPEVGVQRQNSVKMEVFRPWTLLFFLIFFFIALCTMMPYDAPSPSSQKINRKCACSAKTASKQRFFIPGLYNFLKFFIFFHTGLEHHALRCTVDANATTKPEVGVEHQKSVKMRVFRL